MIFNLENEMLIGDRIGELIKAIGCSQKAFAKAVMMSQSKVSKIVNNRKLPSEHDIFVISSIYHVSENWLRHGTQPMYVGELSPQKRRLIAKIQETQNEASIDILNDVMDILVKKEVCYKKPLFPSRKK